VYDPGGDPFIHTIRRRNATVSTAHDDTLAPRYELAQAAHLVFNAASPSSADGHPFLPSTNARHIDATPQEVIQDAFTAAATSKWLEIGLTRDGQDFDPPEDVRTVRVLVLEWAQHMPFPRHPTFNSLT